MLPIKKMYFFVCRLMQKFSHTLRSMGGGGFFKRVLTYLYCTKYYEIDVFIQLYKSIVPIKSFIHSINILYTGSHKSFPIHNDL